MDSTDTAATCRKIHLSKEYLYACLQDQRFFDSVAVFKPLEPVVAETLQQATAYNLDVRSALRGCVEAVYQRLRQTPQQSWRAELTNYIQERTGGYPIKLDIPGVFL